MEPGLDRHEWESEMSAIEEQLAESPEESLPELDELVARMLVESGYDLDDPVALEGDDREVVSEFLAAREIKQAVEHDVEDVSPGDVAAAINGYRAVYEHVVSRHDRSP
jgi:hypothetical protein